MATQQQIQDLVAATAELVDYLVGWAGRDDEVGGDVDLERRTQAVDDALRPFGRGADRSE